MDGLQVLGLVFGLGISLLIVVFVLARHEGRVAAGWEWRRRVEARHEERRQQREQLERQRQHEELQHPGLSKSPNSAVVVTVSDSEQLRQSSGDEHASG